MAAPRAVPSRSPSDDVALGEADDALSNKLRNPTSMSECSQRDRAAETQNTQTEDELCVVCRQGFGGIVS